ncbi:MAG: DUF1311 domain-containing protein [Erythrobacter sp.]|nr:DUF1311 domain-containing protein [Erythrobacter sp.]
MMLALMLVAGTATALTCDREAADQGVQRAMNICAALEYAAADDELNAQWKRTRAVMKRRDADRLEYQPEGDGRPGYMKTLLEAQRAWLQYRDAHCRAEGFNARGGSLEPLLVSTCKTALTQRRTQELKAFAESPE